MIEDYDKGKRLANAAISKIKRDDIIHRGFLKPLEIALKTHCSETTSQLEKLIEDHQYFIVDE